jgi:hypothetical protein
MNPEMKIIREVNIEAEDFYQDAVKIGQHAAEALKVYHRSQMTSLENIAESTLKTSDIFDYLKKQTARFPYWRQRVPDHDEVFGERLKNYLEKNLTRRLEELCTQRLKLGANTYEEKQERRRIYLLMIRQFIRQMVVEYEYQVSPVKQQMERRGS